MDRWIDDIKLIAEINWIAIARGREGWRRRRYVYSWSLRDDDDDVTVERKNWYMKYI